jgi:glutamine synthetase
VSNRAVLAFCREKEVKAVDLRFTDAIGVWRSVCLPVERLTEASFEQGIPVRAPSFPNSALVDRLLIPDCDSGFLDPFGTIPTLILIGSLQDPITREDEFLDPRSILARALAYLATTGIADQVLISGGCEFFVFDQVHVKREADACGWSTTCATGMDSGFDLRNAVLENFSEAHIAISQHRSFDGDKQAFELEPADPVTAADSIMLFKHVVRRTVGHRDKSACFLPQPNRLAAGASLTFKLGMFRGEEPVFSGQLFGGLSDVAMHAVGGILQHAPALSALWNPSTNSFKRLFQHGQGWLIGYSQKHPRSVCRIAAADSHPKSKGIFCGSPDPTANPYLVVASMIMAAVDGIQNKSDPGPPDQPIVRSEPMEASLPRSQWDALDELENDQDFLLRGEVFSQAFFEAWLQYKRQVERSAVESDPTPAEFLQYNPVE